MRTDPGSTYNPIPWFWLALLGACVLVYLFGLGSAYAPTNGDEMVYIHIARMTAESGHWLPLQSEIVDTRNTKPPLLFWQAIVAGNWGQHWSLWALRTPSVVYTLLTTALLAFFTRRISGSVRAACLAAVLYLLFFSTFRYGRVYLTSAPETFWLALPLWWLLWLRLNLQKNQNPGFIAYTLSGVAIGLGAAYKSFALVAPAAATLWCALLWTQPGPDWRTVLRSTLGVAWSSALALGLFALWFVLDPDPAAVWQEFVLAENAGKMSNTQGYWQAALSGPYPMWTQLFAYPANAGLLVFTVLALAWLALKDAARRPSWQTLTPAWRMLLIWLAVWLIVFTIPSQRSERYVIPAMPALAIAMALVWDRIPRIGFWLTLGLLLPALLMVARIGWVMGEIGMASNAEVAFVLIASLAGFTAVIAGFTSQNLLRGATLAACLGLYASFQLLVAPLDASRYSDALVRQLQGQRVAVPNGFTGQYERFHFLLPHARLTPYDAEGRDTGALRPDLPAAERLPYLLAQFDAVVWLHPDLGQTGPACLPQCKLLGERWHIRSRHKPGEVTLDNLWYPQRWLFGREWLLVHPT